MDSTRDTDVSELKRRLAAGDYEIDPEAVATAMLARGFGGILGSTLAVA